MGQLQESLMIQICQIHQIWVLSQLVHLKVIINNWLNLNQGERYQLCKLTWGPVREVAHVPRLYFTATIMDKIVDTFEHNKRFLSASFRNFKNIFWSIANPLSPFSMLQYGLWRLSLGYNIEKGGKGQSDKIGDWKTHAFNKTGLFRGVSQLLLSMIVWIIFYSVTLSQHHHCSINLEVFSIIV